MKNLLILHGALGAKSQFNALRESLENQYNIHCLEFEGHGKYDNYTGSYSIEGFADQTRATLRALGWEKPLVFGYSMGGYVALKLESMHPGTFEKVVTLGTKFNWNPEGAQQEARMLNVEKIEEKVPAFALYLQSLHGETEWKSVVARTADMMISMGVNPPITAEVLSGISLPVHCMRGEKDVMVTEEETLWAVNALQHASYEQVEGWLHPIDRIPTEELKILLMKNL